MNKYKDTPELREKITQAVNNNNTMAKAAAEVGMAFSTFKRWATFYEVYSPNQAGKGIKKCRPKLIPLEDILKGNQPQYKTSGLRLRLIEEGYKDHQCEKCKLTEWLGQPIPLEVDHMNGIPTDHRLENLQILCPNCHAQTPNYRGKNKGKISPSSSMV